MSIRNVIKDGKKVKVELRQCLNLACCRDDHVFCLHCKEVLHANFITEDETVYEITFSRCPHPSCIALSEHLMCPQCYRSSHF